MRDARAVEKTLCTVYHLATPVVMKGERTMRRAVLLIAVACMASCAARQAAPPAPQEPATPFEGTWREIRNQNERVRGRTWTFRGDTVIIVDPEQTYRGTFTYDEDSDPCEMDLSFEGYPVNKAIYRLRDSMLMIKLIDTAPTRSRKLRPERGYIFITCRKMKPEEKKEQ